MRHTYDYGLIGNCAYAAHIHKDTRVSWLCWPHFDSSYVFGDLIAEKEKAGEFSIKPLSDEFSSHQKYIENTNILSTEITCPSGRYRVIDFAPRFHQQDRYFKPLMLIRKIEKIEGDPRILVTCSPRYEYGETMPSLSFGSNHIRFLGMQSHMRLTTNIPLTYIANNKSFVLDDAKYLVLSYGPPLEANLPNTVNLFLENTKQYWRNWVKHASINDFYQKEAIRSALILKIHQFEDTGAIVAATTTSLPESPNSGRNWDYRFCWMRDTYYTLNAFNNIGHFEELEHYFRYILNTTVEEKDRFQPLYSIIGNKHLIEKTLPLEGYKGNKPVRIGNHAYTHIQNDVYGQVLISLLPLYSDKRIIFRERFDSTEIIMKSLQMIEKTFEEKDASLWEFRNTQQLHCYTYLFHWAGSYAALKIAKDTQNSTMENLALKLIKMSEKMIKKCYVPSKKGYAQAVGVDRMDASTLQLIMMNFIPNHSQAAKDHLIALEKELSAGKGLFYRYKHTDDFGAPETTFLICAFWYIEALACVGRLEEAIEHFDQLISHANHVGLLSEDIGQNGDMWGNFPQAYSHVGLLNAASRIAKKLDKPSFLT